MRREKPGRVLQTTALINEAYIKLIGQNRVHWKSRTHFYAIAASCMRRVLIDYAKTSQRVKREGKGQPISVSDAILSTAQSEELLALDAALSKLADKDKRKSKVIELRCFGGYAVADIADILGISEITVARDWRPARAWLRRELNNT